MFGIRIRFRVRVRCSVTGARVRADAGVPRSGPVSGWLRALRRQEQWEALSPTVPVLVVAPL